MNKILLFILLFLSVIGFRLFAQTPPFQYTVDPLRLVDVNKRIPPPPNAAELGRYGECPVSLYTGRPNISIPLYNIEIDNFSLPISLDYNASGIKVSEIASWVGLGWSLNAGGLITRTVKGVRDEIVYNGYTSNAGQFLYRDLADGICSWNNPDYTELKTLMDISEGLMDGEPDEYYYNFGNYSGKFIFDKDKNIKLIPNNKQLKISCVRTGETMNGDEDSIKKFSVLTPDGVNYIFGCNAKDKTFEECIESWIGPMIDYESNDHYPGTMYQGNKAYRYHLDDYYNSWYLCKIILPNRQDSILFSYAADTINNYNNWNDTYFYDTGNDTSKYRKISRTFSIYSSISQRLTNIHWNGGYINFIKSDEKRIDVDRFTTSIRKSGYSLKEILVYNYKDQLIHNIQTTTSYFHSNNAYSGYEVTVCPGFYNRLRLDAVIIDDKHYTFQYDGQELPARYSQLIDFWGFYKNFNLNKTYRKTAKPLIYVYPADTDNSIFPGIYSIYPRSSYAEPQYVVDGANRYPDFTNAQANVLLKITYPTGGSDIFAYELNSFMIDGSERNGGGLRIKRISTYDGITHNNDIIKSYYYTLSNNPTVTSGKLVSLPYYCKYNVYAYAIASGTTGSERWKRLTTIYSRSQSVLNGSQGGMNGYTEVTVKTESGTNNGDEINGKKIYKYSFPGSYDMNPDLCNVCGYQGDCIYKKTATNVTICDELSNNYPGWGTYTPDELDRFPFLSNPDIDFGRGLLLEENSYDNNNNPVDLINYEYCFDNDLTKIYEVKATYFNVEHLIWTVITCSGDSCWNSFTAPLCLYDIRWGANYNVSGNIYLSKKTEIIYSHSNPSSFLTKVTNYQYNDLLQLSQVSTTNSDGNEIKIRNKYISDIDFSSVISSCNSTYSQCEGVAEAKQDLCEIACQHDPDPDCLSNCNRDYKIDTLACWTAYNRCLDGINLPANTRSIFNMQRKHMITLPLEAQKLADNKAVGGNIFEYGTFTGAVGNIYKPKIELSLNTDIPIADCQQILLDNQNNLVYDSRYAPSINFDKYDAKGNLLEAFKENDNHSSSIWAYNNMYQVVRAENIDYNTLLSAVNDATTDLQGLLNYIDDLTNSTKKIIWNNFNLALRANNSLRYALITTYTYKPLVGITSSTDPAGITTYYEYDAFNRLSLVRDFDGNIVKTYDYHYASPAEEIK